MNLGDIKYIVLDNKPHRAIVVYVPGGGLSYDSDYGKVYVDDYETVYEVGYTHNKLWDTKQEAVAHCVNELLKL